jgi:hypothetical protein
MDQSRRIASLERRVQLLTGAVTCFTVLFIALGTTAWARQDSNVLRARAIILTDSLGRERVVLGAPVPEPSGVRIAPTTGMVIRDTGGVERFGVGLFPDGMMSMGFDAPRLPGSHVNRERINIVAGPDGLANIRFLNRKSGVAGYLALSDDDNLYLQMNANSPKGAVWRQVGAVNDTTVVH